MRKLLLLAILTGVTMLSGHAYAAAPGNAGFSLYVKTSHLTPAQLRTLQQFLQSTAQRLPARIKSLLNSPLEIKFADLDRHAKAAAAELPLPLCRGQSGDPQVIYGKHTTQAIVLNRLLLSDILRGPHRPRRYPCKHRDMYRLAQSVLIHEIGHRLDRTLKARGLNHSGSARFLSITDRKRGFFWRIIDKNTFQEASPDAYEFAAAKEAFAVNLEYFLLDPEFACRRPSLHRFFASLMGEDPHRRRSCRVNTRVPVWGRVTRFAIDADLDPRRVYQVHYLKSSRGKQIFSRWGHGMARIILCAPERTRVGPECLEDVDHHVVVNYSANVDDFVLNHWKGLLGGYDSLQFLLRFTEILHEYNREELRDVLSYPEILTAAEKEDFIYRTIERFWTYRGNYKFLVENCSTEQRDLLKSAVFRNDMQSVNALSPEGLRSQLHERDLIEDIDRMSPAQKRLHLFNSDQAQLEKSLSRLQERGLSAAATLEGYVRTAPQRRRQLFGAMSPELRSHYTSDFYTLEEHAYIQNFADVRKTMSRVLYRFDESGHLPAEANVRNRNEFRGVLNSLKKLTRDFGDVQLFLNTGQGYGVPLHSEVLAPKRRQRTMERISSVRAKIDRYVRASFPQSYHSLEETKQNLQLFLEEQLAGMAVPTAEAPL